ncbi:MAG TPA: chromosome segregation protein SMC, partial [Halomonas sp.]|nr:chromosome segregation protein SMC [Halomonas sp.]
DAPRLGEAISVSQGWERVISWLLAPWLNARLVAAHQLNALPEALATEWCLIDQAPPSTATAGAGNRLSDLVKGAGALTEWLASIHYVDTAEAAEALLARLAPGESVVSQDGVWRGRGWL